MESVPAEYVTLQTASPALITPLTIRIRRPAAAPLAENVVHCGDVLQLAHRVADGAAQIVIADPPWPAEMTPEFLSWSDKWMAECLRILRDNGTMFVVGPSEQVAHLMVRLPAGVNSRWLVWHFTNKNTINTGFWQHSHQAILVIWKKGKVFHADAIREPYSDNYVKYAAGKVRKSTQGFFDETKETTYKAHEKGALPRDVMKIPALSGGAARKERVAHPDQRPLALMRRLIESCQQSEGVVFVPFAGSGTECVAASVLKIPFIGIEKEAGYCRMAEIRLALPTADDEQEVAARNTISGPEPSTS
jgi:site-specific DNA-methyltransferase (adenine-specific)